MINYRHDKEISDVQLRPLYQAVGWTAYLDQVSDLMSLAPGTRTS